jgi:hypothetical protein
VRSATSIEPDLLLGTGTGEASANLRNVAAPSKLTRKSPKASAISREMLRDLRIRFAAKRNRVALIGKNTEMRKQFRVR